MCEGLIIDSFGELRDRAEDVQVEMEVGCVACAVFSLSLTSVGFRPSVLCAGFPRSSLTKHHMDLRFTSNRNTTWPTICASHSAL